MSEREAVTRRLRGILRQRPAGLEGDQTRFWGNPQHTRTTVCGGCDHAGNLRAVPVTREFAAAGNEVAEGYDAPLKVGMAVIHAGVDERDTNGGALRQPVRLHYLELSQKVSLQGPVLPFVRWGLG